MAGFSLGGAVNSASDWACGSRLTRGVIKNPIFTALLILALVVIVLMATYREPIRQGGGRKAARAFIYGLLAVTAVMVFHHHAVRREATSTAAQRELRDVFSSIQISRDMGPPGSATGGSPALDRPPAASVSSRPNNLTGSDWLGISDVELPIQVGGRPGGKVQGGHHRPAAPARGSGPAEAGDEGEGEGEGEGEDEE